MLMTQKWCRSSLLDVNYEVINAQAYTFDKFEERADTDYQNAPCGVLTVGLCITGLVV